MRIALASLALLAAGVLTGCDGSDDTSAPAPTRETVTTTATPEPTAEPSPEPVEEETETPTPEVEDDTTLDYPDTGLSDDTIDTIFVDLITEAYPDDFEGANPDDLVDAAHYMCDALDDGGVTFMDLVNVTQDPEVGYSAEGGGAFIGAGIQAYCPEHSDVVPN